MILLLFYTRFIYAEMVLKLLLQTTMGLGSGRVLKRTNLTTIRSGCSYSVSIDVDRTTPYPAASILPSLLAGTTSILCYARDSDTLSGIITEPGVPACDLDAYELRVSSADWK